MDSNRRSAVRDTVQYVQFSKHRNDGVALATELLAELPGQFLEWVRCVCVDQRCGLGGMPGKFLEWFGVIGLANCVPRELTGGPLTVRTPKGAHWGL